MCCTVVACQSLTVPPAGSCFTSETAKAEAKSSVLNGGDPEKVAEWLQNAAAANHAVAIHMVGRGYLEKQQYEAAYTWYERGVPLGDYQSMHDLGVMWLKGEGREINISRAYAWFKLSGEYIPTYWDDYFFPKPMIEREKALAGYLATKMSQDQIELGERYYAEQKSRVECNWYSWYGSYISTVNKRP